VRPDEAAGVGYVVRAGGRGDAPRGRGGGGAGGSARLPAAQPVMEYPWGCLGHRQLHQLHHDVIRMDVAEGCCWLVDVPSWCDDEVQQPPTGLQRHS
jgi:hypothetical protein